MSIRISQLPTATSLTGSEYVLIVQNSTTKKILASALGSGGGGSQGAQGAQGATGPNNITTSTTTNLTGFLSGNGSAVSATTSGSTLTALNGSNISTGTIADARLSANVAKVDSDNTFTGNNIFTGDNNFTGQNTFVGLVSAPLSVTGNDNGGSIYLTGNQAAALTTTVNTFGTITCNEQLQIRATNPTDGGKSLILAASYYSAISASGGSITLYGADGDGGGNVYVDGGAGGDGNQGGNIFINAGGGSLQGGNITLTSGDGGSGTPGNITILCNGNGNVAITGGEINVSGSLFQFDGGTFNATSAEVSVSGLSAANTVNAANVFTDTVQCNSDLFIINGGDGTARFDGMLSAVGGITIHDYLQINSDVGLLNTGGTPTGSVTSSITVKDLNGDVLGFLALYPSNGV